MKLDKSILIKIVFITVSVISIIIIIITATATTANAQQAIRGNTSRLSNTSAFYGSMYNSTLSSSEFLTYQNSTYGIKIQYPSDWIYKGSNNSITQTQKAQPIVLFAPRKSSLHDISNS